MFGRYNFPSECDVRSPSHNLLCPPSDLYRSVCRPVPIFRCLLQLVIRPSRFPICVRPAAAWMDIHLRSLFLSTPRAIERARKGRDFGACSPSLSALLRFLPWGFLDRSSRRGGGATDSKSEITQLAVISTRLSEHFRVEREVRGEFYKKNNVLRS